MSRPNPSSLFSSPEEKAKNIKHAIREKLYPPKNIKDAIDDLEKTILQNLKAGTSAKVATVKAVSDTIFSITLEFVKEEKEAMNAYTEENRSVLKKRMNLEKVELEKVENENKNLILEFKKCTQRYFYQIQAQFDKGSIKKDVFIDLAIEAQKITRDVTETIEKIRKDPYVLSGLPRYPYMLILRLERFEKKVKSQVDSQSKAEKFLIGAGIGLVIGALLLMAGIVSTIISLVSLVEGVKLGAACGIGGGVVGLWRKPTSSRVVAEANKYKNIANKYINNNTNVKTPPLEPGLCVSIK